MAENNQQIDHDDESTINDTTPVGLRYNLKDKIGQLIAVISLVVIALGGINDSLEAVDKLYDITLSQFTDTPSHDKLNKVYIRASEQVLSETFGSPVYIKSTPQGHTVNYYSDQRFILSTISQDQAIAAYLVFPFDGFTPNTEEHSGGQALIGSSMVRNEDVINLVAITSPIVNFYLEESIGGRFGNLHHSLAGYSDFNSPDTANDFMVLLNQLSEAQVMGFDDEHIIEEVRHQLPANFYGYSTLPFEMVESAILTKAEYELILKSI